MCLRVKLNPDLSYNIKKATNSTSCFKIVVNCGGGKYQTPFQKVDLESSVMQGLKRFEAGGESIEEILDSANAYENWFNEHCRKINGGVIHTMTDLNEAIHFAKYVGLVNSPNYAEIWQCEIDRGEEYVSGVDDNGYSCLGSKSIRFKKKLCEYSNGY